MMGECHEELVISGVSGRFPLSRSVDQLADNLFNGVDMVTEDDKRWPPGLYGLPRRHGKLDDIDKFDAQFFGIHAKQADCLDPQIRLLLEVAYEAVVDAGVVATSIRGRQIGVFIGSSGSEAEEALVGDVENYPGYSLIGCHRAMVANRVSYALDLRGPSLTIDTGCASSLTALDQAISSIKSGKCEAALVGGVNLCIRPSTAHQFNRLSVLSPDGKCKSFDANANGYARSEACSVIFVQKITQAKRIYAKVINVRSNTNGYREESITFPSTEMQVDLMQRAYKECNLNPSAVNYIEAHGTGTKAGDYAEVNAIAEIFCPGRKSPLRVGSVKSNVGHTEAAAGVCGIVKVLIAFERQMIPGNLHLKSINGAIRSLVDGRVKPVTKGTRYEGGYAAINSFGFGGVNVHAILRSHDEGKRQQSLDVVPATHPRLVTVCGRTEDTTSTTLNFVKENPSEVTREFLALLNDTSKIKPESGMNSRGFTLLGHHCSVTQFARVEKNRPLWFIMPGMGCQWTAMGRQLMQLPCFAQSINEFALILKEKDIDLIHLLTSDDEQLLDNLVNRFVMVVSVQGALIDLLHSLGVEADGFVGHSQGELVCAYADGCLNKRQIILSAYWRGKCCERSHLTGGSMAFVALSADECEKKMPKDVSIACYNSHKSLTLSGSEGSIKNFVKQLTSENIFAREMSSCGVAFHSSHIFSIASHMLNELSKEIPSPKKRSDKWISSSVPESRWSDIDSHYCSASYLVNNFNSPVLFTDAMRHVPENAITVEISPHAIFKTVISQCLGGDSLYLSLMNKNNENQMTYLFTSLGQLYNLGVNLNLEVLYPPVEYPVPRGTPSISSLMRWDHSHSWLVPKYPNYFNRSKLKKDFEITPGMETTIDLTNDTHKYLSGHAIDGRIHFPATGYLMLAWQAYATIRGEEWTQLPIHFSNVHLSTLCILPRRGSVNLVTRVIAATGEFTITESNELLVRGNISSLSPNEIEDMSKSHDELELKSSYLEKLDIYKEFRVRGYDYGPSFQSIERSTYDGSTATLKWTGQWVSFVDAMTQLTILSSKTRDLRLPVRLTSLKCDPRALMSLEVGSLVSSKRDPVTNTISGLGVEIEGLFTSQVERRKVRTSHEKYLFIPHKKVDIECDETEEYINLCTQVAAALLVQVGRHEEAESLAITSDLNHESINDIHQSVRFSENKTLLKCLCELFISCDIKEFNFDEHIINIQKKYKDALAADLVEQSFKSGPILRPIVDLVLENTPGGQLNVLEVNSSQNSLASIVEHSADLKGRSIKYSLVSDKSKDSPLINDEDNEHSILNLPLQSLMIYHESRQDNRQNEMFSKVCSLVDTRGFLLIVGRPGVTRVEQAIFGKQDRSDHFNRLIMQSKMSGFSLVSLKSDSTGASIALLRKQDKQNAVSRDKIKVIGVNSNDLSWIDELKEALRDGQNNLNGGKIWLINTDGRNSGLLGLVNCLRLEPGGDRIRCIFDRTLDKLHDIKSYVIEDSILDLDLVINVIDANNHQGSYRHLDITSLKTLNTAEHAYLECKQSGDKLSLQWIESCHKLSSPEHVSDGTLVQIYHSTLNSRDLMDDNDLSSDKVSDKCALSVEFSGRRCTGERVMGLKCELALETTCILRDEDFIWSVPDNWSLEEAASVPFAYFTAYYALIVRGSLQPGESVLIDTSIESICLASISICLSMRCQVFVEVNSFAMKELLLQNFPHFEEENIFMSRDRTSLPPALSAINGAGVNLVLCSDEKKQVLVEALVQHGRLIEINKHEITKNCALKMPSTPQTISIHRVSLHQLFKSPLDVYQAREVKYLLQDGISNGTVRPLPRSLFIRDEVESAFRLMMTSQSIDKIIIQMRQEESERMCPPAPLHISAVARTYFHSSKSYIIIGGLGGFGLELANWMVTRGARKLILTSRRGVKDAYQNYSINRVKMMGADVTVSRLNVNDLERANELVDEAIAIGPVGGIFNLALVLRDSLFVGHTVESFSEVIQCKVATTANLDIVSRSKCKLLDHFVVFSSTVCGYGNAGQSNDAFANSVAERICEARRDLGLPALAIQWGPIADVGFVAQNMSHLTDGTVVTGTVPQRIHSCLSALDQMLASNETIVTSVVRQVKQIETSTLNGRILKKENAPLTSNDFINHSQADFTSGETGPAEMVTKTDFDDHLLSAIYHILGVRDASTIPLTTTLRDLAMDSLMAIEIIQILEGEYETSISPARLRSLTIEELTSISRSKSGQVAMSDGHCSVQHMKHLQLIVAEDDATSPHSSSSDRSQKNRKELHDDVRLTLLPPFKVYHDSVVKETQLTLMLKNHSEARTLLTFISIMFLVIAVTEEVTNFSSEEDWMRRNNFWHKHLATLPQFLIIWTCIHAVVCLFVYPAGHYMRENSKKSCAFICVTCVLLIKLVIIYWYERFAASNTSLSAILGFWIALESLRLSMRAISYLVECLDSSVRSRVTFSRFVYFLFAPTFIYKNKYARTPGPINWLEAVKYFAKFLFMMYMLSLWFKNYVQPLELMFERAHRTGSPISTKQLMSLILICCFTGVFSLFGLAWGYVDFFQSAFAELLRFEDREFYAKWWTSNSVGEIFRRWNYRVHEWLERYVLLYMMKRYGKSIAVWAVFLLSGFYHDYMILLTVGFVTPVFTIQMGSCAAFIVIPSLMKIMESIDKRFPNYGSFYILQFFVLLGAGTLSYLIFVESQSRSLCSQMYTTDVTNLVTFRFHHCFKF